MINELSPGGVRRAAIKALGEIEAPGVPDLLRAALHDESSLVRQQAVLSLGKLHDPDTAHHLLPLQAIHLLGPHLGTGCRQCPTRGAAGEAAPTPGARGAGR